MNVSYRFSERLIRCLIPCFGIRGQSLENLFAAYFRSTRIVLKKSFNQGFQDEIVASLFGKEGAIHAQRARALVVVRRTGPQILIELGRYGFYPPGGGRFDVFIEPAVKPQRLDLLAERELAVIKAKMGLFDEQLHAEISDNAISRGTAVMIEIESEHVTEVFSRIGERGVRAEIIAEKAADDALDYLKTEAPVGEHLADQLLIPLSLAEGGSFATGSLSLHTITNIEIIKKFLDVEITTSQEANKLLVIDIRTRKDHALHLKTISSQ